MVIEKRDDTLWADIFWEDLSTEAQTNCQSIWATMETMMCFPSSPSAFLTRVVSFTQHERSEK